MISNVENLENNTIILNNNSSANYTNVTDNFLSNNTIVTDVTYASAASEYFKYFHT